MFIFRGIIHRHRGCLIKLSDIMIVSRFCNMSSENFSLYINEL